ncbi:hypothetical protein TrVE_jg12137 [Triparma verrucosa]|uniref:Methyltransferase type 11 domain-containing protein n=1 Tax=Triparma verrucosa TaxID=1606542 RepID=A0A9W7CFU7_9STRA|nr:hypothetical protein TrVE_jg12137 [Triparma verrucosa]
MTRSNSLNIGTTSASRTAGAFVLLLTALAVRSQVLVELKHLDGEAEYHLNAGAKYCDANAVARAFLTTHTEGFKEDDVGKLTARLLDNPGTVGGNRGCGWITNWQNFMVGDKGAEVARAYKIRYLDVGSAQSFWYFPDDSRHEIDGWLHIDTHMPKNSKPGEIWSIDYTEAADPRRTECLVTYRGDALALVSTLESSSLDAVFTEHMIEHVTPAYVVRSLREWWRVVRVGGAIRIAIPDLERYLRSYVHGDDFLDASKYRGHFQMPWEMGGPSAATLINDLFRNWDHARNGYMWDYSSFEAAAIHGAGIPADAIRKSHFRDATDLPEALHRREFRNESLFITIRRTDADLGAGVLDAELDNSNYYTYEFAD